MSIFDEHDNVDAPLNVLAQTAVLEYNKGSKPSNTAPAPAPRA